MRMVIELRRDAFPQQVLNHLYQHTAMQSSFYCNMLALVDQQPRVLSLKALLREYIRFVRMSSRGARNTSLSAPATAPTS